jgi:predicted dehydrogenase/threonine dehydrogenase-like Zn-dependent dehydrogenase
VKQILQDARTGSLTLAEVPVPALERGQVLVRNRFSVVSPGTESLALAFARKSLLAKARSRPDLVREVARKLRQEGPLPTARTVVQRLESPQPLGYSSAGVVESVGPAVRGLAVGDRVACAGTGYASHAEFVAVPENLVARVPDPVGLEDACFATLGAIALQGLRVAGPALGEIAAVIGLGLIGQLGVQLLRANGCRVLGVDLDAERVKQALAQGAEWSLRAGDDPEAWRAHASDGHGADLALVAASSETSAPLRLAAELCRLKGRIAVIGAMPMELDRRVFYAKELELRMSTSYGPGRYDRHYEEEGLDYPLPYVRWTENRNLQAFLELLASGTVRADRFDRELVPFEEAVGVYEELAKGVRRSLAVVFRYDENPSQGQTLARAPSAAPRASVREGVGVAFLGAGNYARSVLLPAVAGRRDVRRVVLVARSGASLPQTARRFHFARFGTDPEAVLSDPEVDLVFVATRHDSHAALAVRALRAGKAVWLEKPVGLTAEQVGEVVAAARESSGFLAVGYNRRFSRHVTALREAFRARRGPVSIHYCVAAGPPPRGTWIEDPETGGGRIVGELCHFVDLCVHLVGLPPASVFAHALGRNPSSDDSVVAVLRFSDGSAATIEYLARTHPSLPKERFEISADGRTASCRNFRITELHPGGRVRTLNQDKGQKRAVEAVIRALATGAPSPYSLDEVLAVSAATFAVQKSARSGRTVWLAPAGSPDPEVPKSDA